MRPHGGSPKVPSGGHTLVGVAAETPSAHLAFKYCVFYIEWHKRRLYESSRTPSVMVDAILEGMVLAVNAGTDTGNW